VVTIKRSLSGCCNWGEVITLQTVLTIGLGLMRREKTDENAGLELIVIMGLEFMMCGW
jgi:hypothetical protein